MQRTFGEREREREREREVNVICEVRDHNWIITTFFALISHAASSKPCIPNYNTQRSRWNLNLDHQYEINSHLHSTIEIMT